MFLFKKIITPFLLPPGIFIVLLIICGVLFLFKKRRIVGIIQILLGIFIWVFSIVPISNVLLRGLELDYSFEAIPTGDVIILLGAGVLQEVPDLSGNGFPNGEYLGRIVTAVRLQRRLDVPIVVSHGKVFMEKAGGAQIAKRILLDLGVDERKIIVEDRSRDTYENGKYSKEICTKQGFTNPILITSGYHLKRSCLIFEKVGLKIKPFPAYFKTSKDQTYRWYDFLPDALHLVNISKAFHEYLGILYYSVV